MRDKQKPRKKRIKPHERQLVAGTVLLLISLVILFVALFVFEAPLGRQHELHFNEILPDNQSVLADEDGDYPSWIDLHNPSDQPASLSGYSLTDRIENPQKWQFPDITLDPGEYLTIFLSGKSYMPVGEHLHAGFELDTDRSELLLISPRGESIDRLPLAGVQGIPPDISYGRDPEHFDRWLYYVQPSPGMANLSLGYETFDYELMPLPAESHLVINEIVASNSSTYADEDGDYPDWIELYNGHSEPLNLEGYMLSDDENSPAEWLFPDITLDPGEYLVVFASGKDRKDLEDGYLHTSFRINRQEDILLLTSSDGYLLDRVDIRDLPTDVSYGRNPDAEDQWLHFIKPTPGEANTTPGFETIDFDQKVLDPAVYVNEIMASNQYTLTDEDGDYPDWIELYNSSDRAVNLQGYLLSDDTDDPMQWILPDLVIEPDEYLVIFASGKDRRDPDGDALHTSFPINMSEDVLYFRQPDGQIIDRIEVEDHLSDVSYGRDPENTDNWYFYPSPTPGWKNETHGFEQLSGEPEEAGILMINEIMAMNLSTLRDNHGEYPNWIELYNAGDEPINIKNFGLSDREDEPMRWTFPDLDIQPGEHFVIYASGRDSADLNQRVLHTNFGVSTLGERVTLSDPIGRTIDSVHTGRLPEGISIGRSSYPEAEQEWVYYTSPSPGSLNQGTEYFGFTSPPVVSKRGGFFDDAVELTLENPSSSGEIRYSTDGSILDENSKRYTGPIRVDETTVLRAAVFDQNKLTQDEIIHTYFINEQHTLPVVSITVDPFQFEDPVHGIHSFGPGASEAFPYFGANFHKDIEIPANFELYETDGKLGYDMQIGFKLFGAFSRGMDQKSFAIYARNRYEYDEMTYPFLENKDLLHFKHLVLRTSGQDASFSLFRDILMTRLIQDETTLDFQGYRQSVLYINGRFWGVYNIREKINRYFIHYNHGLEDLDAVDILEGQARTPSFWKSGDNVHYEQMRDYVTQNNMNDPEHYAYIESIVDLENFADFWIAQMFYGNTDTGNIRFWREHDPDAKWRWIIYDLDWGFYHLNHNSVWDMTHPQGTGYNRIFSTRLIRGLLESDTFRNMFIERFAYHLNHTFETEHVISLIDELAANIEPEMPRHTARWRFPSSVETWQESVEDLRIFARQRPLIVARQVQQHFNLSNEDMQIFDVWRNR